MRDEDDRELRSAAAREGASLLLDRREAMEPPRGAAEASWRALQARIAAGEEGPDVEMAPARRGGRGVIIIIVTAMAAAAVLWQVSPRALVRSEEERGHAAALQGEEGEGALRARRREAGQVPVVEDRVEAIVPAPVPEPVPVLRARPTRDLAAELAQLRGITEALRMRAGEEALQRAEAYLRAQPPGAFAPEARLHRVEALCLLGREEEARAAAAQFVRELPSSSLRARITAVCPAK